MFESGKEVKPIDNLSFLLEHGVSAEEIERLRAAGASLEEQAEAMRGMLARGEYPPDCPPAGAAAGGGGIAADAPALPVPPRMLTAVVSADDLMQADLPPVRFFVEGLLPQGLTLFASPPKYGKSWFVLDLCLALAAGKPFLGRATERCACLYLALEDSQNRLKTRMERLLGGEKQPDNLFLSTDSNPLGNGLIEELTAFAAARPDLGLVVIDTFQRVRSPGGSRDVYARDYQDTGALKRWADERGIALVLVHHLRKAGADGDPFERISGTNGIFGAADVSLVMTRSKRRDDETLLSITGRDVDSAELCLAFDKRTCRWQVRGDGAQQARETYESDPVVRTIRALLDRPEHCWEGTAQQLLDAGRALGFGSLAPSAQKLGFRLRELIPQLREYSCIAHSMARTGNGSRLHRFQTDAAAEDVWQEAPELALPF